MKTPRRVILAATSDLHINSTRALCPPRFVLDDGGEYRASGPQRFIWDYWSAYWDRIEQLHRSTGWPVYWLVNGETGDDLKHPSAQLVTHNLADVLKLVWSVIERPATIAERVIITRGTEAHAGLSGHIDETVAADLDNILPDDINGTASWWQFRGVIGGVRVHAQHHGLGSYTQPRLAMSAAGRAAARLMNDYAKTGIEYPDLVLFGHTHRPFDSGDLYHMRAINTPAWQLSNAFGHRLGGSWLDIGASICLCDDGRLTVEHWHTNHIREDARLRRWKRV